MANLITIGPDVESQPLNDNFAALNNAKLERNGSQSFTGSLLHVSHDMNAGLTSVLIENLDQRLNLGAYYEASVIQYGLVQSLDDGGQEVDLRINPGGGPVTINGHPAWHGGNNPTSLNIRGYQVLASGLIIQWGQDTVIGGDTTFTLPISYTTAHFATVVMPGTADPSKSVVAGSPTITQFRVWSNEPGSLPILWISVGF